MADFKPQKKRINKLPVTRERSASLDKRKHYCRPGEKWVPSYYERDGTYVRGHCAMNRTHEKWKLIERRRKTTYGLKPLPHIEKETEIIERPNENPTDITKDNEYE
jgi:hypothetical protein